MTKIIKIPPLTLTVKETRLIKSVATRTCTSRACFAGNRNISWLYRSQDVTRQPLPGHCEIFHWAKLAVSEAKGEGRHLAGWLVLVRVSMSSLRQSETVADPVSIRHTLYKRALYRCSVHSTVNNHLSHNWMIQFQNSLSKLTHLLAYR